MTAVLPDLELELEALLDQPLTCSLILICDDAGCSHKGDEACGNLAVAILRTVCIDGHHDQDLICEECLEDLAVGGLICYCNAEHAATSVTRL